MKTPRHLVALLMALLWLPSAPAAAAPVLMKFALEGGIEGPAGIFYLAQQKGYFTSEGVEVTIDPAEAGTDPIARVASGEYAMAIADINLLAAWRDRGNTPPIKAVFMVHSRPAHSVTGRKSRGISTPQSLEGRRLGAPPGIAASFLWPLFAKLAEIDSRKVVADRIGALLRAPMLAAGQVDAVLGKSFNTFVNLKGRGVPADDILVLSMAEAGFAGYGSAVIVNPRFAETQPDAVRGFLRALVRSLKETARRPEEALAAVLERNRMANRDSELERLSLALGDHILTDDAKAEGFGAVEMARLDRSIEQLAGAGLIRSKLRAGDLFDASFLPAQDHRRVE